MVSAARSPILESLESADAELRSVKGKLVQAAPPEERETVEKKYEDLADEIEKRKESIKTASTDLDAQEPNIVELSAELGKLQSPGLPEELKAPIRVLYSNLELNDRLFSLIATGGSDKEKAEASLRWFSQKSDGRWLDFLFENTDYLTAQYGPETATLLEIAKQGIISRGYEDLLEFYAYTVTQLLTALIKTTEHQGYIEPVTLREYYRAELPTQVLDSLKEMQKILEEYVEQPEIRSWLDTPNRLFNSESPREAILNGNTFSVYQFLIGLAQGVHI
jgi:hypothetical protein